jgi:hypothetical protein
MPPNTAGGAALTKEIGFVDHQHRILGGGVLNRVIPYHVAQRIGLPASTAEKSLLTSWPTIARCLSPHRACLAALRP